MPDTRSPIQHHLVLHRRSPEQGVARFYSLMIERDLFVRVVLMRNWGRTGTNGRELVEEFAGEIEASQALEAVAGIPGLVMGLAAFLLGSRAHETGLIPGTESL